MITGNKISQTRFVPFFLPNGAQDLTGVDFVAVAQGLSGKSGIPFFVIISNEQIEIPPNFEGIIEKRNIIVANKGKVSEHAYAQFKSLIGSIYALSYEKKAFPSIGVAGVTSIDAAAYFIIRWMIEEKTIPLDKAKKSWSECGLPEITEEKYLKMLAKVSAVNAPTVPAAEVPQKSNEKDYNSLLKILEKTTDEQSRSSSSQSSKSENQESVVKFSKPLTSYQKAIREISIKCKLFQKTLPLFGTKPITKESLVSAQSQKDDMGIVLEPLGSRAMLYVHNGIKQIVCENNLIITAELSLPQSPESDREIGDTLIEGVFIDTRDLKNTFVVCDVVFYDGLDVSNEEINSRIGYVVNFLMPARTAHKAKTSSDRTHLMIRPIFAMNNFKKILSRLHKIVSYPVRGISFGPLDNAWSTNKDLTGWYTWNSDPELPVVMLSVNNTTSEVFAMVSTPFGMVKEVSLGKMNKNASSADGQFVHINTDSNSSWRIEGSAEGEDIWTKKKFEEIFKPDSLPLNSTELMNAIEEIEF